ncbi:hypothetical protein V1517DRAFT_319231 [Lipomyces orientalis]|uniref:Uncharacterized protein n=1 Tax=Lipomyces orientalis TaxID=1233043 RepID=A0ACC3TT19_9ASCO
MQAIENLFDFGQSQSQQIYNSEYTPEEHKAKFSHEAIAGAASFGAFKVFEDRQRQEGKPVSHAFAKEVLMGLAGAEVDKLIETKGLDFYDRERAKHHAREQVNQMYDSHYGQNECYDPNTQPPPRQFQGYYGDFDRGYDQDSYNRGGFDADGYRDSRVDPGEFGGPNGYSGAYGGPQGGYDSGRW